MATWSKILLSVGRNVFKNNGLLVKTVPKNGIINRMSHGDARTMVIEPTRWQWHKTKDWFHFYFFVGAIPIAAITFYANVFIGPATLEPIPEDYVPKYWEYYRSPITRFFARYFCPNPQEEYEKNLDIVVMYDEDRRIRQLHRRIKNYIFEYQDYPLYSFGRSTYAHEINAYKKAMAEN